MDHAEGGEKNDQSVFLESLSMGGLKIDQSVRPKISLTNLYEPVEIDLMVANASRSHWQVSKIYLDLLLKLGIRTRELTNYAWYVS